MEILEKELRELTKLYTVCPSPLLLREIEWIKQEIRIQSKRITEIIEK